VGQINGQTAKGEQMQRCDQSQSINVSSGTQSSLCTLIGWGWYRCLFFDD
jgi:hypothetical protein